MSESILSTVARVVTANKATQQPILLLPAHVVIVFSSLWVPSTLDSQLRTGMPGRGLVASSKGA